MLIFVAKNNEEDDGNSLSYLMLIDYIDLILVIDLLHACVLVNKIITVLMNVHEQSDKTRCLTHKVNFDLIGNDNYCELNCLICCDCLRTLDNKHKFEGINHKTITIIELSAHFDKIKSFSAQQIKKCEQKLSEYMKRYMDLMMKEVEKEKVRLKKLLDNIILTQITKQEQELKTLQQMLHGEYQNLACKQIGAIAKKLFSFVPKSISPGYKRFSQYIDKRNGQMETQLTQLIKNPHYETIVLKDALKSIKYPDFDEPPPPPQEEPPSPKKTPRRSLRKQQKKQQKPVSPQKSLLDIKDFHVKIKKPLEFKGSEIIKTKQQASFIEKLFPMKVYDAKMLYRASYNNFSVKRFHQYCDGEANTITFVKTEFNKVIGGFTPIQWRSTNNTIHTDIKKQSFLFSITLKQKMSLMDQKTAIFNSSNFGPTFGSGADLAICHNADVEKTSYCEFPYSYANSRYLQKNQHSTFLFTGQQNGNHFLIKQWEVWKLDLNQ